MLPLIEFAVQPDGKSKTGPEGANESGSPKSVVPVVATLATVLRLNTQLTSVGVFAVPEKGTANATETSDEEPPLSPDKTPDELSWKLPALSNSAM
jgi:hypothetical protein